MEIKRIKTIIDKLGALDLSTYPGHEVESLISQLGIYPIMTTTLSAGTVIIRARPNIREPVFSQATELSYKPADKNSVFQRASIPGTTVFYGVLPDVSNDDWAKDNDRLVGTCEVVDLYRDKTILEGEQVVTFGQWIATDNITLACIVHSDSLKGRNPNILQMNMDYDGFIQHLNPEIRSIALLISSYFANEFSKEFTPQDFQYIISAIYASRLIGLTQNEVTLDGILYPSVRAEGRGINVALSKECADLKLKLHAVLQCKVYKKNNRLFVNNEKFALVSEGQKHFSLEPINNPEENISRDRILMHLNR